MFDTPPGAGTFEALLGDVAVGASDLARSDWQAVSQGFSIVQLRFASAQIAVALAHRGVLVFDVARFKMSRERLQRRLETPGFESVFLHFQPGLACCGPIASAARLRYSQT